ncbi:hypothetical protein D9758_010531 [Tetrapyrgos nigripes]|uniref:DUF6535 domain-containing protein n=1 Tax=Tetrapyrgos nigripes TaxID=182062 RepID=A0A8H5D1C0_9AGAR|nr:hypothetical protein D9758_010531 [Tetrapyrgos nigripes]
MLIWRCTGRRETVTYTDASEKTGSVNRSTYSVIMLLDTSAAPPHLPCPKCYRIRISRAMKMSWLKKVVSFLRYDKEQGDLESSRQSKKPFQPTEDDQASAKLWSIYIDEAQRYDEGLLEGWKKDMEGMLLFSALYSASLTAFLIESYKTLQDDPAQNTVFLLAQLSQQFAAAASNRTATSFPSGPPPFGPPASALICNVLWFLSLALALTCSLLATFVQQWTRDFIHKTKLRPSPIRQARVIAYMYSGLRDFGMHSFVDVIPILLHVSLFFFFAGLVAFLLPVNRVITYIMACVLGAFILVYTVLTLIPLIHLNSPYRTPLSGALWRFGNVFAGFLARTHDLLRRDETLTEALLEKSVEETSERDKQALVYTMKSLTDDNELLPMIEAIPDLLYNANDPVDPIRRGNVSLLLPIVETDDTDVNVICHIAQFIRKSNVWTDPSFRSRSALVCPQALWSITYALTTEDGVYSNGRMQLSEQYIRTYLTAIEELVLPPRGFVHPQDEYMSSAIALMRLSTVYCLRAAVDSVAGSLRAYKTAVTQARAMLVRDMREKCLHVEKIVQCVGVILFRNDSPIIGYRALSHYETLKQVLRKWSAPITLSPEQSALVDETEAVIIKLQQGEAFDDMRTGGFSEYLSGCESTVLNGKLPHEFVRTCAAIHPGTRRPRLPRELADVIQKLLETNAALYNERTDVFVAQCFKFFPPEERQMRFGIGTGQLLAKILRYFCCRAMQTLGQGLEITEGFGREDSHRIGEGILQGLYHPTLPKSSVALDAALLMLILSHREEDRSLFLFRDEKYETFPLQVWKALHSRAGSVSQRTTSGKFQVLRATLHVILVFDHFNPFDRCLPHSEVSELIERLPYKTSLLPLFPSSLEDNAIQDPLKIALKVQWMDAVYRDVWEVDILAHLSPVVWRRFERMKMWWPMDAKRYRTRIPNEVQIRFAQSYANLIEKIRTSDAGPDHYLYQIHRRVIDEFIQVGPPEPSSCWDWITNRKCAKVIISAIKRYNEFFGENAELPAQSLLLARCKQAMSEEKQNKRNRIVNGLKKFALSSTLHGGTKCSRLSRKRRFRSLEERKRTIGQGSVGRSNDSFRSS